MRVNRRLRKRLGGRSFNLRAIKNKIAVWLYALMVVPRAIPVWPMELMSRLLLMIQMATEARVARAGVRVSLWVKNNVDIILEERNAGSPRANMLRHEAVGAICFWEKAP